MYYRHDERIQEMNMALVLVLLPVLFIVTFGISALDWMNSDAFLRTFMGYGTIILFGVWIAILEGETRDFRSKVRAMLVS